MWSRTWASLIVTSVLFSLPVSAQRPEVWSGLVSDTKDGKRAHRPGDVAGVKNCVIEGAKYALLTSEGGLYELGPQDMVAGYVGEQVVVTGTHRGRTIYLSTVQRIGQPSATPRTVRIDERWRIMRSVRRIHVFSKAMQSLTGIGPEPLLARLLKEPEFQNGIWQLVDSPANADLTIELNRVQWTWDFTYRITHPPSGLVFGSGKVIAWDGVRAGPGLGGKIIKDLRAVRAEALANLPAPSSSPGPVEPPPEPAPPLPAQDAKHTAPPPPTGGSGAPVASSRPMSTPPGPAPVLAPADLGGYRLRVEVQLVMVEAVVQGPGGAEPQGILSSLTREDFSVSEDGVQQPIQHFSRHTLPLAVALVVDASGSVAPYMTQLRQAALETLALLNPGDRAALFCFANNTQRVVDLTTDTRQVAEGISQISAGGGTNIFDALADAVSYLQSNASAERRVVILVSDNAQTVQPRISQKDLVHLALRSESTIYSIQTTGERTPPWLKKSGSVEDVARETGGEVISSQRAGSVSAALAAVIKRLKTRYTLGYYASNKVHDGTFRVIDVRLAERLGQPLVDYSILSRRGYYAPREGVAGGQGTL